MPSRIIQASITSGANVDKVGGTYVTFGSILSDTGAVSGNYKVTSASLYLSYHRTYSTYAYLNVIYGGSGGAIVARTNNISSDSNSHSATYPLTDLSINLLTMGASAISLGVVATNSTSGNKINVRDSCTLTLTINYEEESSGGDSGGGSTGGGSANDPTYTNGVLAPTEVKLSSTIAAPGAKVTLSWSGTYVYAPPNCNNIITNYWVYRATADPDDFPRSYEKIWEARPFQIYDPLDTSGECVVTAPTVNGETYYYRVAAEDYASNGPWKNGNENLSYWVALKCEYSAHTAPTGLHMGATNAAPGTEVLLSWTGVTPGTNNEITKYEVYRATDPSGVYELLTTVETASRSGSVYVTSPTENGASYLYKVKTIGSLEGMDSDLSTATATLTCTYSVPSAPAVVTIEGETTYYSRPGMGVLLAWSGENAGVNNPIAGYDIYRDGVLFEAGLAPNVSSYIVTAHEEVGHQYQYSVVTRGMYSDSAPSVNCVVKSYSDPVAPTNLFVTSDTPPAGSRFRLSWSGAEAGGYNDILSYRVYRAMSQNGSRTQIAIVPSTDTFSSCYVNAPATVGTYYYLWVETVGSYSTSGMSETCVVICTSESSADGSGYSTSVVVPQPKRHPKRSFVFDDYDTAAHGWTLAGWSFPEPKTQTNYLSVPGRVDGPIDLSVALTNGEPRFGSRDLTVTLECSDGTRLERDEVISEMVAQLHGESVKIVFPDDAHRFAIGRLNVRKDYNDLAHAAVTVAAVCEPWRYNQNETVVRLMAAEEERTVALSNEGRRTVVPSVVVSGIKAKVYITLDGKSWTLSAGSYRLPDFMLSGGSSILTYSGYGTLEISYREAII